MLSLLVSIRENKLFELSTGVEFCFLLQNTGLQGKYK